MRSLRLLAALSLTVATALTTTTTADAAVGDGTLTVTLVDEHGDPMPGILYLTTGPGFYESEQAVSTITFEVPSGPYAVVAITPWGGIQCAGLDPCDYFALSGGTSEPSGDVTVTAGQDTPVAITGVRPATVGGTGRIGAPLSLELSAGMSALLDYLGGVGGAGLAPTVTWLRNGEPIPGAADVQTYFPVAADVGKKVSARLEYTGVALTQFQMVTGGTVTPRTTNAVPIRKVPTKTFAILSNPRVKAGNHGKVRVEVTAKNLVVTGKVTVTLGGWSQTRSLRNGTTRVLLPVLEPGRYVVGARFRGSRVYSASASANRTLAVTS